MDEAGDNFASSPQRGGGGWLWTIPGTVATPNNVSSPFEGTWDQNNMHTAMQSEANHGTLGRCSKCTDTHCVRMLPSNYAFSSTYEKGGGRGGGGGRARSKSQHGIQYNTIPFV